MNIDLNFLYFHIEGKLSVNILTLCLFVWLTEEVIEVLSHQYPNIVSFYPNANGNQNQQGAKVCLGCTYQLPDGEILQDYNIIFIGKDGRTFTNFILELAGISILSSVFISESNEVNFFLYNIFLAILRMQNISL